MDRSELRERLRTLSGVLMDTLLTDQEADAFLNEAYLALCGLAEWSFLYDEVATSASSDTTGLPGSLGRVQAVLAGGRALQRRDTLELARYPQSRQTGEPWAWAPVGDDAIRVFPTPEEPTEVEVRGWIDVAPMASDAAEPLFASEFHAAVAYEAAANVLESEGDDSGRSERYRGEVMAYLDRMARRYLPDGGQVSYPPAPTRVRGEGEEGDEA